jgi:hypothetical protein
MPPSSVVEITNGCKRAPAEGEIIEVEMVEGNAFLSAVKAARREYAVDEAILEIVVVVVEFSQDGAVLVVELWIDEGEAG